MQNSNTDFSGHSGPRSISSLSRRLSSLLSVWRKEWNCYQLSLDCKCGALKIEGKTHTHTHTHKKNNNSRVSCSFHTHAGYCFCAFITSSSSPLTAAEEGAGRPLRATELARTGRVCALCDECVQISDANLVLCLSLWEDKRAKDFPYSNVTQ